MSAVQMQSFMTKVLECIRDTLRTMHTSLLYEVIVASAEDMSVGVCVILDKATNPSNRQEEWEHMMAFCDQVNKDPEG